MAHAVRRGLTDWIAEVASIYPAAVRHGGGYWSEMVGNASSLMADGLEAMIDLARQPNRSGEVLTQFMDRSRHYAVASGSTFERILLDFNQALVQLGRLSPQAASAAGARSTDPADDRMAGVFQQLADFATNEAMKLQGRRLDIQDIQALRRQLEACLAELRRLEGDTVPGTSRAT